MHAHRHLQIMAHPLAFVLISPCMNGILNDAAKTCHLALSYLFSMPQKAIWEERIVSNGFTLPKVSRTLPTKDVFMHLTLTMIRYSHVVRLTTAHLQFRMQQLEIKSLIALTKTSPPKTMAL